jgi:hypothetical protein
MMSKTARNADESQDELELLYLKLLKVFYEKPNYKQASAVAEELEKVAAARPGFQDSIKGEEVRSLLAEVRGDLNSAARSREAEIRKILELHALSANTPGWPHVLRQYDYSDISDRLDLLAALYDKQGDEDRAIATLQESKQWCQSHQIAFDGQDLLDELLEHRGSAGRSKRRETA